MPRIFLSRNLRRKRQARSAKSRCSAKLKSVQCRFVPKQVPFACAVTRLVRRQLLSSNFSWGFLLLPEHVPASDQTVQHRGASRSVSLQRLVAGLLLFSAIGSGKALASYDMKTGGVYAASSLGGNPTFKGGTLQLDTSTTISSCRA